MSDALLSKTVKALGHLGLGGALSKIISLGTTLVLTRLLSPADYGLMAIAMIVISFVGFFNEVGIGSAIVQKEELSVEEVNGCFAIAIFASLILCLITVLASGLIANFFEHAQLQPMLSVLAIAFIVGAVSTVPLAYLRREMRFKVIAGVMIVSVIIQSLLTLALAATGHGVWSLVWGCIVSSAVQSIGFFCLSPWRPKGRYGIREATGLVTYGLHVTNTRLFWYLYTNADKVIIGKVLGAKPLGIYDMAFSLATLPTSQVTSLVINVASPLFSKLQNDLPRLSSVILKLTRGIAYVTYPALIGILVTSRELVGVVLGANWIDILIPFGALCLMGLIKSVDPLLSQVLMSTGHVKKLSAYTALCGVVMSLAVVVGALWDGLQGVSLVWILVYPLLSIKLLRDACKVTGIKMIGYYKNLLPPLIGSLMMGISVMLIREICFYFSLPMMFVLAIEILTGAMTYFLWIVYLDVNAIGEMRQVMIDLGIAQNRLDRWPFNRKRAV